MKPFANETDVITVGDLTIENRKDRVTIYGSITKDRIGISAAFEALKILMAAIVAMINDNTLPDTLPTPEIPVVENPFEDKI